MSSPERNHRIPEDTAPKEVFSLSIEEPLKPEREWEFVDTSAIIIAGPPGAGTSSDGKLLIERLSLSHKNLIRIGDLRRKIDRDATGMENTEDIDRNDPNIERQTDMITRRLIQKATPENPVILEAQLGGFIGTKVEEQAKRNRRSIGGRVVKILIVVDENEGAKRVKTREEAKGRTGLTTVQWLKINRQRHKRDLKNWRHAYPELRRIDPHNANATDKNGEKIWRKYYDTKIDSTFCNEEEMADRILLYLWENGYIRKKKQELLPMNQN